MLILFKAIGLVALSFTVGDVRVVEKRDSQGKLILRTHVKDVGGGEPVKHGTEIAYYSDGSTKSIYQYQNNVLDGPWKEFYANNGKVRAEGTYHHGNKDGMESRYLAGGDKIEQTEFKDGRRNGKHIEWGPGAKKTCEATYVHDALEGTLARWYSDDPHTPRSVTHFLHGELDGLDQSWYPSGDLEIEAEYKAGKRNGLYREWYQKGVKRLETRYKDGVEDGKRREWYSDTKDKIEATYVAGQLHGQFVKWHDTSDQSIEILANYDHGRPVGVQHVFYSNGNKKDEITFKDGVPEGAETEWHENGQIKSTRDYKNGKLDGPWRDYFEDGRPQALTMYKKGLRDGRVVELNKDGKPIRDQVYSEGVMVVDQLQKAAEEEQKKKERGEVDK
jgi:antitoxin component YwqK of YwqJK toxin-antitoxin module